MACRDKLRRIDIFGLRVSLTYKGKDTYRTRVGGCFTLLLALFVLLYAAQQFNYVLIQHMDIQVREEQKWNWFDDLDDPWNLSKEYTVMGHIEPIHKVDCDLCDKVDLAEIVRVQFYIYNVTLDENGDLKDEKIWVPAVHCKDKYKEYIEKNP